MTRRPPRAATLLAGLGVLAGCAAPAGGDGGAPVSARAGDLLVELALDAPSSGPQRVDLTVTDAAGRPVDGARVTAGATMPGMGHTGEVAVATARGDGRYRLSGSLFPMPGEWSLQVEVERAGTTSSTALFVTTD